MVVPGPNPDLDFIIANYDTLHSIKDRPSYASMGKLLDDVTIPTGSVFGVKSIGYKGILKDLDFLGDPEGAVSALNHDKISAIKRGAKGGMAQKLKPLPSKPVEEKTELELIQEEIDSLERDINNTPQKFVWPKWIRSITILYISCLVLEKAWSKRPWGDPEWTDEYAYGQNGPPNCKRPKPTPPMPKVKPPKKKCKHKDIADCYMNKCDLLDDDCEQGTTEKPEPPSIRIIRE